MKREYIIKKSMKLLRSSQTDSIKKELQDYIKEDAQEIFDQDDVKVSGRVSWDKLDEYYKMDDMEIESAKIVGFAHHLLHDLYIESIPEKNQRVVDAEELSKEFLGKVFPFKTKLGEHDLSGDIKVLGTKYSESKDEVSVTKFSLDNIQVD